MMDVMEDTGGRGGVAIDMADQRFVVSADDEVKAPEKGLDSSPVR